MSVDDKVVIGRTHGTNDPEAVLIGYLLGVEALRAGKQVLMWLTKDGGSRRARFPGRWLPRRMSVTASRFRGAARETGGPKDRNRALARLLRMNPNN